MSKLYRLTAFALMIVLCAGCGGAKASLPDDRSGEVVLQPYAINSLQILDDRGPLRLLDWKLPLFTVRASSWVGDPVLEDHHRSDINRIIKASQDPAGIPAEFKFVLRKGELELYGDAVKAREFIRVKGELSVFIPDRNHRFYVVSSIEYEIPTYNATEKHARRAYDVAIRNLCSALVKQIREELGSGGIKI